MLLCDTGGAQSRVGPQAEVTFLKSFGGDGFHIAEVEDQDIRRMADLVETYIDLPLGVVGAAVIAIGGRLGLRRRLTEECRAGPEDAQRRRSDSRSRSPVA